MQAQPSTSGFTTAIILSAKNSLSGIYSPIRQGTKPVQPAFCL
jgi:hypothetical protein